jgi:hypothetical protein
VALSRAPNSSAADANATVQGTDSKGCPVMFAGSSDDVSGVYRRLDLAQRPTGVPKRKLAWTASALRACLMMLRDEMGVLARACPWGANRA